MIFLNSPIEADYTLVAVLTYVASILVMCNALYHQVLGIQEIDDSPLIENGYLSFSNSP